MSRNQATLVILHGWSQDQNLEKRWQPLIKLLSKARFQVKYLKLPGFELPLNRGFSLNDYQNYVLKEIKEFKKVILLGHSFGGQLGVRVAAANPKNLEALILIGPAGIIDRSFGKRVKRQLFKLIAQTGSRFLSLAGFSSNSSLYKFMQHKLHFAARESNYLQASPNLKVTMQNVLQEEIRDDLPKITVPSLIFWGTNDNFTPIKNAPLFATKIPNAQLKVLKKERHRPYYTQPELVARHIINFIQKNVA